MYSPTPPPPVPPPKPSSHDASRLGTPAASNSPRPPPPVPDDAFSKAMEGKGKFVSSTTTTMMDASSGLIPASTTSTNGGGGGAEKEVVPDPGDQWLPKILEDKSKQDLADILSNPSLLSALTHAPATAHPSLTCTRDALLSALDDNVALATHLAELEARLAQQRGAAQAQLLSTHALERQWRQKQAEMDAALAPFSPAALYARLGQSLAEQEAVCRALEESFLDGDARGSSGGEEEGAGLASERETLDWVRRYRDAKKLLYLRHERRERWNEHRVGGWR
ncbi:uncharacterized protein F4812DRAFT_459562 [Daldinia caldariorum]|uniref:uncharacterized protein n=1 Tax=Daldinia caldariorum TaxID=326644 RepID=UPI002008E61A|nr:uncharacterized protein F4812DRAFT_459562 [Daldinia caldariorum]KAI1467456.1 hypothetical protein F4812DRAFT_459562 [Daldinia caldariorum]